MEVTVNLERHHELVLRLRIFTDGFEVSAQIIGGDCDARMVLAIGMDKYATSPFKVVSSFAVFSHFQQ